MKSTITMKWMRDNFMSLTVACKLLINFSCESSHIPDSNDMDFSQNAETYEKNLSLHRESWKLSFSSRIFFWCHRKSNRISSWKRWNIVITPLLNDLDRFMGKSLARASWWKRVMINQLNYLLNIFAHFYRHDARYRLEKDFSARNYTFLPSIVSHWTNDRYMMLPIRSNTKTDQR